MKHRSDRLKSRFDKKKYQIIRIKQDAAKDEYDGVFTSDHIIDQSGFVDFCFVGKYMGHDVVFNACITTADSDYYDALESQAFDEIDYPDNMPLSFSSQRSCAEETIMYNHYREHSLFIMNKLNERELTIPAWNIELDHEYKFGIGLHIRINKPYVEIDDILSFIEVFKKKGTRAFDDKKDEYINKNAEELGVKLPDDDKFIRWDRGMPNVAALNI